MNILLIINDPPYGTERRFNALRLALALLKGRGKAEFLMDDAVLAAIAGQSTPDIYYDFENVLKGVNQRVSWID
jgi:uncharacterized protein involved in oxidation of intracellular sulfur